MHFLLPNFIRFVFFWLKDDANQRAKISLDNNQTPAWANKKKEKTYHSLLIHWGKPRNRTFNNRNSNDILFSLELGKSEENKNFKLQISHAPFDNFRDNLFIRLTCGFAFTYMIKWFQFGLLSCGHRNVSWYLTNFLEN